jgi:hypothetical protein
MGKSQSPREPDKVVEVNLVSSMFYPLIQSTRRIMIGVASGVAFYLLQAEPGAWVVLINLLSIIIVMWLCEI